jgi:hypothetical protein
MTRRINGVRETTQVYDSEQTGPERDDDDD